MKTCWLTLTTLLTITLSSNAFSIVSHYKLASIGSAEGEPIIMWNIGNLRMPLGSIDLRHKALAVPMGSMTPADEIKCPRTIGSLAYRLFDSDLVDKSKPNNPLSTCPAYNVGDYVIVEMTDTVDLIYHFFDQADDQLIKELYRLLIKPPKYDRLSLKGRHFYIKLRNTSDDLDHGPREIEASVSFLGGSLFWHSLGARGAAGYNTKRSGNSVTVTARMRNRATGGVMDVEGSYDGKELSDLTLEWWHDGKHLKYTD